MIKIPARLSAFLEQNKIRYRIIHHPEAFTSQELAAIEHVKGRNHMKVIVARIDGRLVLLVLPADLRVDLEKLGRLANQEAVLATESEFKALFPDCAVGTMPPFGHLYGIETWVDNHFPENEFIVFEAGTHADAIRMNYADYLQVAKPKLADFSFSHK